MSQNREPQIKFWLDPQCRLIPGSHNFKRHPTGKSFSGSECAKHRLIRRLSTTSWLTTARNKRMFFCVEAAVKAKALRQGDVKAKGARKVPKKQKQQENNHTTNQQQTRPAAPTARASNITGSPLVQHSVSPFSSGLDLSLSIFFLLSRQWSRQRMVGCTIHQKQEKNQTHTLRTNQTPNHPRKVKSRSKLSTS